MKHPIPSAADVRALLQQLDHAALRALAGASKVPFTTLWKIRAGETTNPGLDTVRRFLPHVRKPRHTEAA